MTGFLRAGVFFAASLSGMIWAAPSFAAANIPSTPPVLTMPAQPATAPLTIPGLPPAPSMAAQPVPITAPLPTRTMPAVTSPTAAPVASIAPAALTATVPARAGPSLHDLVISYVDYGNQDADGLCLAGAIYFEARGEPLEGQLAVAQVVLNRAASGRFPAKLCDVVTQPAQFSFVRGGQLPSIDKKDECWHRALAIADIARKRMLAGEIASNVLWYHATYVSPSWDRERTRFAQIGTHIFFS